MKRNTDRIYFDRGYRQAYRDKKIEGFWPRIVAFWAIFILSAIAWWLALTFLFIYTIFEYSEYRDSKKYGKDEKVPPMWE